MKCPYFSSTEDSLVVEFYDRPFLDGRSTKKVLPLLSVVMLLLQLNFVFALEDQPECEFDLTNAEFEIILDEEEELQPEMASYCEDENSDYPWQSFSHAFGYYTGRFGNNLNYVYLGYKSSTQRYYYCLRMDSFNIYFDTASPD